jgi:hypothetical protein
VVVVVVVFIVVLLVVVFVGGVHNLHINGQAARIFSRSPFVSQSQLETSNSMQTSSSVQTLLLEVLVVIELTTGAIEVVVVSVHFAPEYATAGLLIKSPSS